MQRYWRQHHWSNSINRQFWSQLIGMQTVPVLIRDNRIKMLLRRRSRSRGRISRRGKWLSRLSALVPSPTHLSSNPLKTWWPMWQEPVICRNFRKTWAVAYRKSLRSKTAWIISMARSRQNPSKFKIKHQALSRLRNSKIIKTITLEKVALMGPLCLRRAPEET